MLCFRLDNCIGRRLSDWTEYIPAAPEGLDARWETREDEKGNVFPVVHARWNMVDDGKPGSPCVPGTTSMGGGGGAVKGKEE